jgi:2,3-bisphosphoglycerate-independent phosphoglycerate mutase
MKKTTLLCILDGFGLNPDTLGNAIAQAKKPVFDSLFGKVPTTTLTSHGEKVGLPAGQMGNSEVGHLNIGAGRVIEQWLVRITRELSDGTVEKNNNYAAFIKAAKNAPRIHLFGLFSEGGVHSHLEHLKKIIDKLATQLPAQICLHVVTDGRDVAPHQALKDIETFQTFLSTYPQVKIASVVGRFFAMDRDKRWERTEKAFNAFVFGSGTKVSSASEALESSYKAGVTDEFIEPHIIQDLCVAAGDALLFWNFRDDRMRQIVHALCSQDCPEFNRGNYQATPRPVLCFTEYDPRLKLPELFTALDINNHLGEVVSTHGLRQLRVAETEKYPHVTYFLNGGIEKEYTGEERKLVPSAREVRTYDLKPEMSAPGVTDIVVQGIESGLYDLIVVNLANCDMVGHTGVLEAGIRAVETVDLCLGKMLSALQSKGGQAVIIADHGNADQMIDYISKGPYTAHTTFPVPCMVVGGPKGISLRIGGALCDVAPTVLKLMELEQPVEMTGTALF